MTAILEENVGYVMSRGGIRVGWCLPLLPHRRHEVMEASGLMMDYPHFLSMVS